jgi:general secretion pathway protein H
VPLSNCPTTPEQQPPGDNGFTLLEMLVVLAIMSMTIAAATISFRGSGGAVRLQPLAVRIAADLKLARAEAIAQNRPVEVAFDAAKHAYQVQGSRAAVVLPGSIGFTLVTPAEFRRNTDGAHLVFFADGSSTGGRVTLTDNRLAITLMVDWLTGAVTATKSVL